MKKKKKAHDTDNVTKVHLKKVETEEVGQKAGWPKTYTKQKKKCTKELR